MNTVDHEDSFIVNAELQIIRNLVISRYFSAAGLVLLLYDTVLTIEDESRLVWPGPFKFPKLLYYINRYWTIASLIATNYLVAGIRQPLSTTLSVCYISALWLALTKQGVSCQNWVFVTGIAEIIAEMASSAIVTLRVAALYERKIWVVRGLWTITGLLWTATIILAIFTIKSFYKSFVYDTLSGLCLPVDVSFKPSGIFSIPLAFDAIIVILTMFKTYRLAAAVRRESGAVILYTMLRDGILYFIIIVALRLFNTLVWAALPNSFLYLGVYTYRGIISTLTSRLFLNLRSAAYNGPNYVQNQSITAFPWRDRRDKPQESVQIMGHREIKAINLTTTPFATPPSIERSTYDEFEPRFG